MNLLVLIEPVKMIAAVWPYEGTAGPIVSRPSRKIEELFRSRSKSSVLTVVRQVDVIGCTNQMSRAE